MSNNIRNIKTSVSNTVTAATSTVAVGTEVLADSTKLVADTISATPTVMKALLLSPFSAAKGYLMEAEGLSEQDAEKAAFKYLEQDVATTIKEGGEGAGKLLAELFKDLEEDDDKADKKLA